MSRKLEIRSRMAELQKEFTSLSSEVKEIEAEEKYQANLEKFKEYTHKVGTYGYELEGEDKISELTDDDRGHGHVGASGLAYCEYEGKSASFRFVMLKSREEHSRVQTILRKIEACQMVASDKVKDKEPYIKILLGEV